MPSSITDTPTPTIWVTKVSDRLFKIEDIFKGYADTLTDYEVGAVISQTELVKLLDSFIEIKSW